MANICIVSDNNYSIEGRFSVRQVKLYGIYPKYSNTSEVKVSLVLRCSSTYNNNYVLGQTGLSGDPDQMLQNVASD